MVGEFVEMLVPEKKRWGHQAYRRGYFAEPRKREMDPGLYPQAERRTATIVPVSAMLEPVRVGGNSLRGGAPHREGAPTRTRRLGVRLRESLPREGAGARGGSPPLCTVVMMRR